MALSSPGRSRDLPGIVMMGVKGGIWEEGQWVVWAWSRTIYGTKDKGGSRTSVLLGAVGKGRATHSWHSSIVYHGGLLSWQGKPQKEPVERETPMEEAEGFWGLHLILHFPKLINQFQRLFRTVARYNEEKGEGSEDGMMHSAKMLLTVC